jgi:hypothetical protein
MNPSPSTNTVAATTLETVPLHYPVATSASETSQHAQQVAPPVSATLRLNPANPGHYFACCGLFELAARLAPDALAWFAQDPATHQWHFHLANTPPLATLLEKITAAEIEQLDTTDSGSSPLKIEAPFHLRLDWWNMPGLGGTLKTWAGRMSCHAIASSMKAAMSEIDFDKICTTAREAPFRFDARLSQGASPRDGGFAADEIGLGIPAFPAVEFLCLVGLQRSFPKQLSVKNATKRSFSYHLWTKPVSTNILLAAVNGLLPDAQQHRFSFSLLYRTKYLKSFMSANRSTTTNQ